MTNFGESRNGIISNSQLPSFSFVTVDTIRQHGDQFLTGVLAYNGLVMNVEGRNDFDVTTNGEKNIVKYAICYAGPPTVLVFLNWFSINNKYIPRDTGDVIYGINLSNSYLFSMTHGTSLNSYLGFNFLVMGPDIPTENIKHGTTFQCTDNSSHDVSVWYHIS